MVGFVEDHLAIAGRADGSDQAVGVVDEPVVRNRFFEHRPRQNGPFNALRPQFAPAPADQTGVDLRKVPQHLHRNRRLDDLFLGPAACGLETEHFEAAFWVFALAASPNESSAIFMARLTLVSSRPCSRLNSVHLPGAVLSLSQR